MWTVDSSIDTIKIGHGHCGHLLKRKWVSLVTKPQYPIHIRYGIPIVQRILQFGLTNILQRFQKKYKLKDNFGVCKFYKSWFRQWTTHRSVPTTVTLKAI